jgi:NADH-quinone oxidoreductase subunit A
MLILKKKIALLPSVNFFPFFQQVCSSFCFSRLVSKTSNNVRQPYFCLTLFLTPNFVTLEKVEYFKAFNLFIIILVISLLLFGIAYFLSLSTIKDSEKLSQYECGFEPFDEATRHPFDVHFYVVGILFLIFDVEIALLFPWVLGLKFSNWFGFFTMIIFLGILTVGFFYEWHRGALMWPHKQIKS